MSIMKPFIIFLTFLFFFFYSCKPTKRIDYLKRNIIKYNTNYSSYNGFAMVFYSVEDAKFYGLKHIYVIPIPERIKITDLSFEKLIKQKQVIHLVLSDQIIDSINHHSLSKRILKFNSRKNLFERMSPIHVNINYMFLKQMRRINYSFETEKDIGYYPTNDRNQVIIRSYDIDRENILFRKRKSQNLRIKYSAYDLSEFYNDYSKTTLIYTDNKLKIPVKILDTLKKIHFNDFKLYNKNEPIPGIVNHRGCHDCPNKVLNFCVYNDSLCFISYVVTPFTDHSILEILKFSNKVQFAKIKLYENLKDTSMINNLFNNKLHYNPE